MLDEQPNNSSYYKLVYFFIANQILFKKIAVGALVVLNVIVWLVGGIKIITYLVNTHQHQVMLMELVENGINWESYHQKNSPEKLDIVSLHKINLDNNHYDLLAKVYNPNSEWSVEKVTYAFVIDGYVTDWQSDFVLPQQNKFLFKFSYPTVKAPQTLDLQIQNIKWRHIETSNKINTSDLNNILIEDKIFSEDKKIPHLSFKATNNTSFNFWKVGWQIVLYQGSQPVAISYLTSDNFFLGDQRTISTSWDQPYGQPTTIEIKPDIDIFDDNYLLSDINTSTVNLIRGAATHR